MRRTARHALALLVAGLVTVGVAVENHSVVLLLGTFVVYALTVVIGLRYPAVLRGRDLDGRWTSAALAGGTTFGVLSLAQGIGPDFHVGAGVLGFGLVTFGVVTGVWMAESSGT